MAKKKEKDPKVGLGIIARAIEQGQLPRSTEVVMLQLERGSGQITSSSTVKYDRTKRQFKVKDD